MDLHRLLSGLLCLPTQNPREPDRELVWEQPHKWVYLDGSIVFSRSCANLEADLLGAPCERDGFDLQLWSSRWGTHIAGFVCTLHR